jgi:glycosyltransferase involved in cell wall biosynthesis
MPRLLICSPSHAIHGGVESIAADLCRHLPALGWEALLGLGRGGRFNDVGRYREAYPDLPVVELDGTRGTRQARREGVLHAIRASAPDVVLVARVFDAYPVVSALKRARGAPRLAVTIQAYEPEYLFDARLYRRHIDLCVTSGELLRRAAVDWAGVPAERAVSVPGGVRPPEVPVAPRDRGEILRLGYVGRLDPGQKRIGDLVALVDLLERSRLRYRMDVVGTGPAEADLRRRLAGPMAAGQVAFHGWLSGSALYAKVYPELDALVHFAHTEGVTIAPREAMAHGVVPVVSRFTGLAAEGHFVHEANALTFPVGDVEAAARCVRRLADEPGLLPRLSACAMRSQQGRYSAEGAVRAWAESLDRCLGAPARTGDLPRPAFPPDGRLARLGLPPWWAQRVRDVLGRRHAHADPGSEWPTASGLMTREAADAIRRFALDCEAACVGSTVLR